MPLEIKMLELPGMALIKAKTFPDQRGFFRETFQSDAFQKYGLPEHFLQDNHSRSTYGVLRGLHYQLNPHAQGKLVMSVTGSIFDVGVDIRQGSPTFGRWLGFNLSDKNSLMLYIPPGFAHGFCVLSKTADVVYKVTGDYAPELDRGIAWDDPEIGIKWPLKQPLLSNKDQKLPSLSQAENNYLFTA